MSRLPAQPAWVVVVLAAGVLALALAFTVPPGPLVALTWVVPVIDALNVFGLIVVVLLGAQDALLRRDGRSLPLVGACAAAAPLWAIHFAVLPGVAAGPAVFPTGFQAAAVSLVCAHLVSRMTLALALLLRPGHRRHPRRDLFLSIAPAIAISTIAGSLAVVASPHLPRLVDQSGAPDWLYTGLAAAAMLPSAAGIMLFLGGRRGDERIAVGISASLILYAFSSVALLLVRQRYDAFFYVFNVLRLLPVIALVSAQMGLHRYSVTQEQARIRDLGLLHDAARVVGSSLDLERTLAHIAQAALALFQLTPATGSIRIFRRRGQQLELVGGVAPAAEAATGRVLLAAEDYPLAARVIATGEAASAQIEDLVRLGRAPAAVARADGHVSFAVGPMAGSGGVVHGVLAIYSRERREFDEVSLSLLESLAQLAGLAIANAETFGRLAESELRFRTMFEGAGLAILIHDPEGRIREANPAACRMLGYRRRELLRLGYDALTPPEERQTEAERLSAVVAGIPGVERWEKRVLRRDGVSVTVEVTAGLFPGPMVVQMLSDQTERGRAEAAARESQEKSRFLATMSHELRTPLASVIGFAQFLESGRHGSLNVHQARHVQHILESSRHLLGLVDEVLDVARIESGRSHVTLAEVDLNLVVQQCLAELAPLAQDRRLELSFVMPERHAVLSNRLRLRQVLFNLVANSIKFTPAGGQITVGAERIGRLVCISVSDSGAGIPLDEHERVFKEFTQGEPEGVRGQGGAGLGLAVARALAELLGGRLTLASQPGLGSLFTLTQAAAGETPGARAGVPARPRPRSFQVVQDAAGRVEGAGGIDGAVRQELRRAAQHGFPVTLAVLARFTDPDLPAAARSGDLVVRLADGRWLLVMPNADPGGAAQIVRRALGGAEPLPEAVVMACTEDGPAETLLATVLQALEPELGRVRAASVRRPRAARLTSSGR